MAESRLIIGLGNPGRQYEHTRHNLGFLVVDDLAGRYGTKFSRSSSLNGWVAQGRIGGQDCIFFKPLTYMNNSGVAVKKAAAEKGISHEDMLVVCDDLNLDFGQVRLRRSGSDGGHNGLSSVIAHLRTQDFARLRLGIGAPPSKEAAVEYVLEAFDKREKKELDPFIRRAGECCLVWLEEGAAKAMSQFNKRKEEGTRHE